MDITKKGAGDDPAPFFVLQRIQASQPTHFIHKRYKLPLYLIAIVLLIAVVIAAFLLLLAIHVVEQVAYCITRQYCQDDKYLHNPMLFNPNCLIYES